MRRLAFRLPDEKSPSWGILFLLVGAVIYLPAIHAPWYFDDFRSIVENARIVDLKGAWQNILQPRGVVNLSFALNYTLGGMSPWAFRVINFAFHFFSALLVWRIFLRLDLGGRFALFGGLLFLVHPVQTQTVIYIVQRMAGMAAFFFFLSVYLWLLFLQQSGNRWSLLCYGGGIVSAALAVWSKQNTLLLPFVLLLIVFCTQQKRSVRRPLAVWIFPFLLLSGVVIWQQFSGGVGGLVDQLGTKAAIYSAKVETSLTAHGATLEDAPLSTPWRYFATQWPIYWHYLRLFVVPTGLMLDYSWPLASSFFNVKTILSVGGFFLVALFLRLKHLFSPVVFLGLGWIVLTLAVESTLIPLDPVYEHRLYLPLLGMILLLREFGLRPLPNRFHIPIMSVTLLILSGLTFSRSTVWADPVQFWLDNIEKAPHSARAKNNLAKTYYEQGEIDAAAIWYERALQQDPSEITNLSGLATARLRQGNLAEAKILYHQALSRDKGDAQSNSYLGSLYVSTGDVKRGLRLLEKAVEIAPTHRVYLQNLAVGYDLAQRTEAAEKAYRRGLLHYPENVPLLFGLALLLDRGGRSSESLPLFAKVVAHDPQNEKALFYYATVASRLGNIRLFETLSLRLQAINPDLYRRLQANPR